MSHFAVVTPAFYSHFQAFQALAGTLIDRGHHVTFFQQADARRWLTDPRIGFHALGASSHPPGSLDGMLRRAACSNNPLRLRGVIRDMCNTTRMLCAELPAALAFRQIDALLCDQMEAAGGLVAEGLAVPFVSVACALPVNREPQLPLAVMPFAYATDERSQQIYEGSRKVYDWLMRPLSRALRDGCRRLAIEPRDGLHECLSPYAQISQTITGFDFPRQNPADCFHAVGSLRTLRAEQRGEWLVEPDRPFIFASLGTLQGNRYDIFKRVAQASRQLNAQLLVAHCGGLDLRQEQRLVAAGATWVTDFAPQQWALQQADAVVTHGGLNTVMDAIVARTPMLVMPIAFDQPGVAARVTHAGVGLQLRRSAGAGQIRTRLKQVQHLSAGPFDRLAAELTQAGGTSRAADIVEAVVRTGQPVLARQPL